MLQYLSRDEKCETEFYESSRDFSRIRETEFRILETSALEQVAPPRSKKFTRFSRPRFFSPTMKSVEHSLSLFFLIIVYLQYRYNKINRCSNYVTHARETERERESINFTFRYTLACIYSRIGARQPIIGNR